uniref:Uncharacterized protein n=1 Tax=virus sp. ctLl75 TaxID=2828249 RepID=A0A8S5RB59_9VIRU|nr:MAG TPA: hypothetical protein [virus sp. ctLl75]
MIVPAAISSILTIIFSIFLYIKIKILLAKSDQYLALSQFFSSLRIPALAQAQGSATEIQPQLIL